MTRMLKLLIGVVALAAVAIFIHGRTEPTVRYDLVISNGLIFDGLGGSPYMGGIAVVGDKIVAVGSVDPKRAETAIDAKGKAIAPGFINVLSWATESLLVDGRSQGDIRQGVTTEVFGEGWSMGPITVEMRHEMIEEQGDLKFDVPWTSLGDYLMHLERKGISPNVASFMGATTARINVIGQEDRPASAGELSRMQELVAEAMEEGALGIGSSLIYAPAAYADTRELIALMQTASRYGGSYISHIRSEGDRFEEAVDELITIARETNAPAEIYHLKAAGQSNWAKMDRVIAKVEAARAEGLRITADMYSYTAGATGLDAMMPPWVQEGGFDAWSTRLQDMSLRQRLIEEISTPQSWENLYLAAGTPDNVLLTGFKNPELKPLIGKTLTEVAEMRGISPVEAAIELVIEDGSRVGTAYFIMSEENVRKKIQLPWMSFGSDAGSYTVAEPFTLNGTHPRTYGNFARVFAKYVREDKVLSVEEAVRKMTSLPAENLKLRGRGMLKPGYYADIVIFDPETIQDHATFDDPHQYSTGVSDVIVNGIQVLRDNEHTGATPGVALRGPGWTGWQD